MIFITGIGTEVGKTVVSAIVTEALGYPYWKPVQSGARRLGDGDGDGKPAQSGVLEVSDGDRVRGLTSDPTIIPPCYDLELPASPHYAARQEGVEIAMQPILERQADLRMQYGANVIVEGAGGLLVPLNDSQFMTDLIRVLDARVIIVSRNYLGSINHSLLTAAVLRQQHIPVLGWIFNGGYIDYSEEISRWSGYPVLGIIPETERVDSQFVKEQAQRLKENLLRYL